MRLDASAGISASVCDSGHERPTNSTVRHAPLQERVELLSRCPGDGFPKAEQLRDFWVCVTHLSIFEGFIHSSARKRLQGPSLFGCPFAQAYRRAHRNTAGELTCGAFCVGL